MFLTLSSFSDTVSKVRRLNNRLEKKGLPLITYKAEEKNMSFAEIFPQYALPKHYGEIRIDVVDFSFTSDFEKFQLETGWEFIAVIEQRRSYVPCPIRKLRSVAIYLLICHLTALGLILRHF